MGGYPTAARAEARLESPPLGDRRSFGASALWPRDRGEWLHARPATLAVAVVVQDEVLSARIQGVLAREARVTDADLGGRMRLTIDRLQERPDVIITDARGRRVEELVRRLGDVGVVVVLGARPVSTVRQLMSAGVAGVVRDAELDATLTTVVRTVGIGHMAFPRSIGDIGRPPTLSYRQRQILRLVVDGLGNDEIARRLYLAKSTVTGHLTTVFRNLGVRSRSQAVTLILADESLRRSVLGTWDAAAPERVA